MSQHAHISHTENQQSYPFGYIPVLFPGIVYYLPCWLPSWSGWIASWTAWVSPPWVWPPFLWIFCSWDWMHGIVITVMVKRYGQTPGHHLLKRPCTHLLGLWQSRSYTPSRRNSNVTSDSESKDTHIHSVIECTHPSHSILFSSWKRALRNWYY